LFLFIVTSVSFGTTTTAPFVLGGNGRAQRERREKIEKELQRPRVQTI